MKFTIVQPTIINYLRCELQMYAEKDLIRLWTWVQPVPGSPRVKMSIEYSGLSETQAKANTYLMLEECPFPVLIAETDGEYFALNHLSKWVGPSGILREHARKKKEGGGRNE